VSGEQKIRAVLFYLSVLIFILGLPFILTYTMGYQFDRRAFKFTRTGLISLKTEPPGAGVHLDKKILNDKTPCSINELLPGKYNIELTLEDHYSYSSDIEVFPGKVSRMEKVILFPLRTDVKKLNKERISSFWIDEAKGTIYYVNREDNAVYKSDLEGEHFEKVANFVSLLPPPKRWDFSPDKKRLLYFNIHQIGVINLVPEDENLFGEKLVILNYPSETIQDVFWYSDSYHLVVIGDKKISMLEARPNAQPLSLVNLNKRNSAVFYEGRNDILYFSDSQKAEDGKYYDNIYKLELKTKLFPFQGFIGLKPNEREQEN
jgi:hypothetical protein